MAYLQILKYEGQNHRLNLFEGEAVSSDTLSTGAAYLCTINQAQGFEAAAEAKHLIDLYDLQEVEDDPRAS